MTGPGMFTRIRFRTKLMGGFLLMALLGTAAGSYGITVQGRLNAALASTYNDSVLPAQLLDRARSAVQSARSDVIASVNSTLDVRDFGDASLQDADTTVAGALKALRTHHPSRKVEQTISLLQTDLVAYDAKMKDLLALPVGQSGVKQNLSDQTAAFYTAVAQDFDSLDASTVAAARAHYQAAKAQAATARATTSALLAMALGAAVIGGLLLTRALSRPIAAVSAALKAVALGDLAARVHTSGRDEFAEMSRSLNQAVAKIADTVDEIDETVAVLARSSEELTAVSLSLAGGAEQTSAQAGAVALSVTQVNAHVQSVAGSAEQMGESIREIARTATDAARVAEHASVRAHEATATVNRLGSCSQEIGSVIKIIESIAKQTHLLALNATIEAARAGEYGLGFAVVANEVKELAMKSAQATTSITPRINALQAESRAVTDVFEQTQSIVLAILDAQSTIAGAVEQQTATTHAIATSIAEAAAGSGAIERTIAGVADGASATSSGASETQRAAEQLAAISARLRRQVNQFRRTDNGGVPDGPVPDKADDSLLHR